MSQNTTTKTAILTYLSTLALFIGTGFISGAIVHTGNISELYKYLVIGIIGISLFIAGSFVQESVLNAKNLKEEGAVKFFIFSLLLSVGIGMISGGTQHFSDFPIYSSYLVPIGLIISYTAFLLKNNFEFTKNLIIVGFVLAGIAGAGFVGLNTYAKNLVEQASKDKTALCNKTSFNPFIIKAKASASHENDCPKSNNSSSDKNHDMSSMVTRDETFIYQMLPHHQEAINTSQIIVASTQDAELKSFAQNVITAQNSEVSQMKNWYKQWFNKEYLDNPEYMPMMTDMNSKSGIELDKTYIQGMVAHHQGAVQMAEKVLTLKNTKPEIKTLAQNIIRDQNKEIEILNDWLKTKFDQNNSAKTSSIYSTEENICSKGQSKRLTLSMCMDDPELKPHKD